MPPLSLHHRVRLIVRASLAGIWTVGFCLAWTSPRVLGRGAAGGESTYLPIVQSRGSTAVATGQRLAGMEGFGISTIDIRNWLPSAHALRVRLRPAYENDITVLPTVGPDTADRLALRSLVQVPRGRYATTIASRGYIGFLSRTEWPNGAAAAYEACEPGTSLILPLTVRDVYSHTSILYFQNTDESSSENKVDVQLFDNSSGELMVSFSTFIPGGQTISYDTWFDDLNFGDMPINAGDGGSILATRITAQKPLAVMAFGDEMAGDGTSAFVARPVARASTRLLLPSVRANYLGNSLIAIANPSLTKAVNASIAYRAHGVSASEPAIEQPLRLEPRGATYVDLARLNRGLAPPTGLPIGTRLNRGFEGHAVIAADGPLLAVVQDEAREREVVHSVSAYNAFGEADLGQGFSVPRVRVADRGRRTQLAVLNPGGVPVEAVFAYRTVEGAALHSDRLTLAAGASAVVRPAASLPEDSQLDVTADGPLALLVCETTLLDIADWGRWGEDAMCYWALRRPSGEPPTPEPTATGRPSPSVTATATATRAVTGSATATPAATPLATSTAGLATRTTPDGQATVVLPYLGRG